MKKADLKKAIKPLVKECIQEVLLEEGLLSNIVSEVANGLQSTNVVVEAQQTSTQQTSNVNKHQQIKLNEHKKKMLEAIGKDAYNGVDLFEGPTPAPGRALPLLIHLLSQYLRRALLQPRRQQLQLCPLPTDPVRAPRW